MIIIVKPYYKTNKAVLYQCDNLELLKQLPENYIDLIYGDILYNTGKKFKDYDDNLGTPQEAILWYESRLIEMKRILKDTGSIYLQCDYRLVHYLKVKMDEIFGIDNFQREIIWNIQVLSGYKTRVNNWIRGHDNILFYSKSKIYIFNKQTQKQDMKYLKRFNKIDENGRKYFDGRGNKRYLDDVIKKVRQLVMYGVILCRFSKFQHQKK